MIDFHSHIIPNIDDGSKSMEDTLAMVKEAKSVGFTDIVATSHYIENYYETDEEIRKEFVKQIQSKVDGINIIIGNEIYVTQNIVNLLKEKRASTINNTHYVLFELPMNSNILYLKDVIFSLLENRYIPIIAHPERYSYVQKNPNWVIEYIDMGVLFQANLGSAIGMYGKDAQKTLELLLKNNMIHFLGSDAHRKNSVYKHIPETIKRIEKIIGSEMTYQLTTANPNLILEDKKIEVDNPKEIKRGFWNKFK